MDVIETKTIQLQMIMLLVACFLWEFFFFLQQEEQCYLPPITIWSDTPNFDDFISYHSPPHAPGILPSLLFLKHGYISMSLRVSIQNSSLLMPLSSSLYTTPFFGYLCSKVTLLEIVSWTILCQIVIHHSFSPLHCFIFLLFLHLLTSDMTGISLFFSWFFVLEY